MTGNHRPRWAIKRDKGAKIDPEVRVMYKVVGVIAAGLVIWTILERL